MPLETAIQKDVENEEKEVVVGNTERDDFVNDMAKRAREERNKELGIKADEPEEEEKPETEDKADEQPEDDSNEDSPEEPEASEDKVETVKIKVDGEEREVPRDKIYDAGIRALQKESSADKRLEEATRLLREIEQKYVKTDKQEESPPQEWDDATIAYALEHGNEEQKAYAVGQLRKRDTTTPDDMIATATQRVLDTVDFRESSQWFMTEYKDVAGDPYLLQLAAMAENKAREQGDKRPRKELYKHIGDELRKWKGGISAPESMEKKKEQKSKIVNLPSASVKKKAPEEKKPPSTADIIENMRKARGQA